MVITLTVKKHKVALSKGNLVMLQGNLDGAQRLVVASVVVVMMVSFKLNTICMWLQSNYECLW